MINSRVLGLSGLGVLIVVAAGSALIFPRWHHTAVTPATSLALAAMPAPAAPTMLPASRPRRFWLTADAPLLELGTAQAIVLSADTGAEIVSIGAVDALQPVASLTKLLTARVVEQYLTAPGPFVITAQDITPYGRQDLPVGRRYSLADLLAALLIDSSNIAGKALARLTGLSAQEFLVAMKQEAYALGLVTAEWADSTGLDPANQASAREIARLLYADAHDEWLRPFLYAARYTLSDGTKITTTNLLRLPGPYYDNRVVAGKTGYIEEAGFSVAVLARLPRSQREVIVVVLGSKTHTDRFKNTSRLIDWVDKYVTWNKSS